MSDKKSFQQLIWTDNEQSRYMLWDAYVGFVTHYNNYEMYRIINKSSPVIRAGLWKYAVFLYEELRFYTIKFEDKLRLLNHDLAFIDEVVTKNRLFEDNNLLLIRRFFNDFFILSGLKNVVYSRDVRDNLSKLRDKYGIAEK